MSQPPLVLVVEDDEGIRSSVCQLLHEEGYQVHGARNGREALEYLRSGEQLPSLILLDLLMPEVTGWEVMTHLSCTDHLNRIPVAAMSGVAMLEPTGTVRFLRKPLDLNSLLNLVEQYCH